MLVNEDGPGRVFRKLREASGVQYSAVDELPVSWNDWTPLVCTRCTSVYVAFALFLAPGWFNKLMAASAISVLLDKVLKWPEPT
jgi:hypothetical protein